MTRSERLALAAIAFLALAAAATSLANGFAYDDQHVIVGNAKVHTLAGWWRLFADVYWPPPWVSRVYRPGATLLFALEWVVGGGRPVVFHAVSILLTAATSVLVYQVARWCVRRPAALLAGALFAVHPVHVEAVGNIVGQAELVVGLACVAAVVLYLRARESGVVGPRTVLSIAALYAIACLTKDNGIVLPALLAAAELTLLDDGQPLWKRVRPLVPLGVALVAIAGAYLVVRTVVVGGVGGGPHPAFTSVPGASRAWTMLGVVPEWLRLLFWPARLSADYSPPEIAVRTGFDLSLLPALVVALGAVALVVFAHRHSRRFTFAALWIAIAIFPVSNLLVPTGVLLAERTLYLASVGAVLMIALAAEWAVARAERDGAPSWLVPSLAGLLICAGTVRSALRHTVWHDSNTVFAQMVVDAPLSFRAHWAYGGMLFQKGNAAAGEREYRIAMRLFPYEPEVPYELAESYRGAGMCPPALPLYRSALELRPAHSNARIGLILCLIDQHRFGDARAESLIGIDRSPAVARPSLAKLLTYSEQALATRDSLIPAPPPRRAGN